MNDKPNVKVETDPKKELERKNIYSNPVKVEYLTRSYMKNSNKKTYVKIIRKSIYSNGVKKERLMAIANSDKEAAEIIKHLKQDK